MLRFLLILAIVTYIFYKVGTFLFKLGAASQQLRNHQNDINRNAGEKKKEKPKSTGEYIDFEEIK